LKKYCGVGYGYQRPRNIWIRVQNTDINDDWFIMFADFTKLKPINPALEVILNFLHFKLSDV
jgi:hypothetical protein